VLAVGASGAVPPPPPPQPVKSKLAVASESIIFC